MLETLSNVFSSYGLITSFAIIGITIYIAYVISDKFTMGKVNGSAIAIILGLILAYIGGVYTGGVKRISGYKYFCWHRFDGRRYV